jgi:hypothetical protein
MLEDGLALRTLIPLPGHSPRERGEGGKTLATLAFSPLAGRRCRQADEGLNQAFTHWMNTLTKGFRIRR